MVRILLALTATLFCFTTGYGQNKTTITLGNTGNAVVENNVSAFLTAVNTSFIAQKGINWSGITVTENGKQRVNDLYNTAAFRCGETRITLNLLNLPGGDLQLRNIPVIVKDGNTTAREDLIITLNAKGEIKDLFFGIEQHRYKELASQGETLQDFRRRQFILDFLENFRTAYNRKDLALLEATFSENALIIVGRVVEETDRGIDAGASLGRKKVELIKRSKQEYLSNLKQVFKRSQYINVRFNEIEIVKHGLQKDIYGVNLLQKWTSGSYSDEGYLFLMIDFENENHPLIHVRSWQPEKHTAREEVIELGDFDIVK